MQTVITFKDCGQDFLKWTVDKDGNLMNCWPFQFSIWQQWNVLKPDKLKVGGFVKLSKATNERMTIKYPIEHIETIPDSPF